MQRIKSLDSLKFLMIFAVVLGHLSFNDKGIGIYHMIYSCHMPIFCFLSGYFTSINGNREKVFLWLKKIIIIYLLAQLFHVILEFILLNKNIEPLNATLLGNILFKPRLALWYLLCLVYWRLVLWKFKNINDMKLLLCSSIFSILAGFIPIDHDFAFQRAFSFFPYFVIGYIFRKRELMNKLNKIPIMYALFVIIIGFMIARLLPMYMPKFHYTNWFEPIYRIIQFVLGLILCLSFIRFSNKLSVIEGFSKLGRYTLWIYIGHTYLIILGEKVFPILGIGFNFLTAILLSIAYCALFVSMAKIYDSYKVKFEH